MKYHIDITPEGYSATFIDKDDNVCGTDSGPISEVNAICGRVQADPAFVSATYTGALNPVPGKFQPAA